MIGNLRYHLVVLWAMAVALVTVNPAFAGSSKWSGGPESQARLFVATDGQGVRYLALHINLAKGWKTYWRNAGDAGAPPELDWSGSKNIELTTAQWPAPKRTSQTQEQSKRSSKSSTG